MQGQRPSGAAKSGRHRRQLSGRCWMRDDYGICLNFFQCALKAMSLADGTDDWRIGATNHRDPSQPQHQQHFRDEPQHAGIAGFDPPRPW